MPKRWSVVSAGSLTEDESTVGAEQAGGCRITAKDDGWARPVIFPGIFRDSAEASAAIEGWKRAPVEDFCT
jgi:hypothetical protein